MARALCVCVLAALSLLSAASAAGCDDALAACDARAACSPLSAAVAAACGPSLRASGNPVNFTKNHTKLCFTLFDSAFDLG